MLGSEASRESAKPLKETLYPDPLIWDPSYKRVLYGNPLKGSTFWILIEGSLDLVSKVPYIGSLKGVLKGS